MIVMAYDQKRYKLSWTVIGLFVFSLYSSSSIAAGIHAGTSIKSEPATVLHGEKTLYAETIIVHVYQGYGIELNTPPGIGSISPGGTYYFPVSIQNVGNGSETCRIQLFGTTEGWSAALLVDTNKNSLHDLDENKKALSPVKMPEDSTYYMLVALTAPQKTTDGEMGVVSVRVSGSVKDGGAYLGTNGVYYGGADELSAALVARLVSTDVSAPNINNLKINNTVVLPNEIIPANIALEAEIVDNVSAGIQKIEVLMNGQKVFEAGEKDWKGAYTPGSGKLICQLPEQKQGVYTLTLIATDKFGNSSQLYIKNLHVYAQDDIRLFGTPQANPNGFNAKAGKTTLIRYNLSAGTDIGVAITDLSGKVVRSMRFRAQDEGGKAGKNNVPWDGRTDDGSILPGGIYFYKIIHADAVLGEGRVAVLER